MVNGQRCLASLVVAVLGLAGCGAPHGGLGGSSGGSGGPGVTVISAGEGAGNLSVPISRRLTTEQAVTLLPEEAVEDVRRVNASTKGGIPYEFLALGDGEILAARKPSFRQTKGRARVGVLDLEGTFSPFPEASGHPTWPSGALAGDWTREHAVWAETASPEKNAGRWAVYSADRRKGTTRIVASGRGMAGAEHPVPPGGIRARIAGRYVYWPVRTAESVVDGVRSTVQIERRLLTGRGDVEVWPGRPSCPRSGTRTSSSSAPPTSRPGSVAAATRSAAGTPGGRNCSSAGRWPRGPWSPRWQRC